MLQFLAMNRKFMLSLIPILITSAMLVSCLLDTPQKPATPLVWNDQPEIVARMFFMYLHDGDYQAAVDLYEGSYEFLITINPDLDPSDHPALLARACQINGFVCLQMGEVLSVEETTPGEIHLMIQFLTDSGEVFQRSPCCGAGEDDLSPISEFPIRLVREEGEEIKVLDLPPFVP
jgi:hypothetical protein